MPPLSIGDMSQQFTTMRNTSMIKSDLARLSESLSTGRVTDIAAHLNGETARFTGIQHSLTQLDAYQQIGSETQRYLTNVQTVLDHVDSTRISTAERLLLVSDSSTTAQLDEAAYSARSAFDTVVRTLNTRIADRALMGGTDVAGPPLAPPDDMIADMRATIGASTDLATITAAVETWFNDPAGGFATMGYLGDTGAAPEKRITEAKTITLTARADDPAIIEVLEGAALAALAQDIPGLTHDVKTGLLMDAGARLFQAASDLVSLQARVGFTQEGVANALAATSAQQTTLNIAQNDLISADPFETASRLQAVQLQLEKHYTVTARLSQLSLLRYI